MDMELLMDNYIWIIVGVVVILMTIIGYIAEKTNFGKKEFSKRKDTQKETPKEVVKEQKELLPQAKTEPTMPTEEGRQVAETFTEPIEQKVEMPQVVENETIGFTDPLADDMAVSSEVLNTPYEPPKEEVLSTEEDLNAPFGEEIAYETPMETYSEISEDLNAPFGDFEVPSVSTAPTEELEAPLSDTHMMQEDLNAPFGDEAQYPTREEFDLDLPDIDSIKTDVGSTDYGESDDDDIWKF